MNGIQLCRLCLVKSTTYVNIFSDFGKQLEIEEKLAAFFPFHITKKDTVTTIICNSCLDLINNFYEYYKKVIANQSCFDSMTDFQQNTNLPSDSTVSGPDMSLKFFFTIAPTSEKDHNDLENVDHGQHEYYVKSCETMPLSRENNQIVTLSKNDEYPKALKAAIAIQKKEEHTTVTKKKEKDILPIHLKTRMTKAVSDAKIKEFVNLICDLCENNIVFDTFKLLQEHFKQAHNIRGYVVCCEKKIHRKDRLIDHITNHINPDAFKCPECGQKRKSKILLRIHMKQHLPDDNRKFQCKSCLQKFVLKSQLTNHEATHFTEDQKRFVCEICGKAFALKFVMMKHKLIHSKEKNFVCEICAKSFSSKTNLQSHMSSHFSDENATRVQCNYCNLWYKNVGTLRTHMHHHRDLRQHICPTCNKKCTTKSTLAAHIRYVHKRIKEFECNICKKEFRRRLELKEHIARHSGQILYKCPFCPKTFNSSSNYFSHRKNRHPSLFAGLVKEKKLLNASKEGNKVQSN